MTEDEEKYLDKEMTRMVDQAIEPFQEIIKKLIKDNEELYSKWVFEKVDNAALYMAKTSKLEDENKILREALLLCTLDNMAGHKIDPKIVAREALEKCNLI